MLDQSQLHAIEARCTQESAPNCRTACPLDMDVRAFVEHMAQSNATEARKLIERHLPLPAILCAVCDHPCETACLRRDLGGGLAISELEQLCLASAPQQTRPLIRPPKDIHLAVLGAGLAGLVCANDIARKGFSVTVYHSGPLDAALLAAFPQLDAACVAQEADGLRKFHVAFTESPLDAALLGRVSQSAQAVFVDASCCAFAPERDAVDAATLLWRDTVCCGGWWSLSPTGTRYATASAQAGEGRCAGVSLQRLMTGASLSAAREQEQRRNRLHTPLDGVTPLPRVVPAHEHYTVEEAALEAQRCLPCSCMQCVKECAFLQKYKKFPRVYARRIFSNATIVRGNRTSNALMNGCALCGQCTEICPERFSMAELCLEARRDAVSRDVMPDSAHEFALEDMAQASGPDCAFYAEASPLAHGTHAPDVFFPGCQLAASRGEQVLAMHKYLQTLLPHGVALWSSCCGIPAHWGGRQAIFNAHSTALRQCWETHQRPRVIAACASCMEALRMALPEAEITNLWSVLDAALSGPFSVTVPPTMQVQDPCGARHDSAWCAAVRSLAGKAGIQVREPVRTGTQSACCGYGGLVWNAQADLADAMTAQRAAAFDHPVLNSCIMCRDRFAHACESWHMFDILPPTAGLDGGVPDPGLSARRAGRAALKERATTLYGAACDTDYPAVSAPNDSTTAHSDAPVLATVHIDATVLQVMERRYILRQDVAEAVAGIERTGAKFRNADDGHFLGSWRPRNVTFWVEYTPDAQGGYVIHDAWCHRMVLAGATQPAETVVLTERVHA